MSYKQNIKFEETGLKVGDKYTLLSVSDFMANTIKSEIQITGFRYLEEYAQYKNLLVIMFKTRGKRKEQGFYLKESMTFLTGWDLPLTIDSDTGKGFKGNALINLVVGYNKTEGYLFNAEVETLRDIINKTFVYGNKGLIFFTSEEDVLKDDGEPLFLEQAQEIKQDHAIIRRALENEQR